MNLDDVAEAVWAKIDRNTGLSLSLPQHLTDAEQTAGFVWDEFLPRPVRQRLAQVIGNEKSARVLAIFLARIHDLGKASPAFEIQGLPHLISRCENVDLEINPRVARDRKLLPHGLAGQIAFEQWLEERNWTRSQARAFACPVGGHHGVFPEQGQLMTARSVPHLLGTGRWHATRIRLLENGAERTGAIDHLDTWSRITLPRTAQALLTAIVIVSDWIASNVELFEVDFTAEHRETRARDAWKQLELPTPWAPTVDSTPDDVLLANRFSLPQSARLRPVQRAALDLTDRIDDPGLFIIEAPMGTGKTEAALLLAERLAIRLDLGGLIFALPSMATSDAMFGRTHRWISNLPHRPGQQNSVFLAHSKAHLNEEFRSIPTSSRFIAIDDAACAETNALVHEWLSGRKKGVLATFVVGTIDQVLFTALKSKHLVLRHLGLAGKVVIIDEVHAADDYMAVYLDRTLEWLGAYGVPVILLSATLPAERRKAMAQAYDTGRGTYTPPTLVRRGITPALVPNPYDDLTAHTGYPMITATTGGAPLVEIVNDPGRSSTVQIAPLADDDPSLIELLDARLVDGGCAVVIRNTVSRAQRSYQALRDVYGADVTLMHSRFIATDRMVREDRLRHQFGPPGDQTERPHRHIVVATQVVEQSLDVDFDLMITDIAPVDLVLQRSGRLHRHDRPDRPLPVRDVSLFITGVADWTAEVPEADKGAVAVYGADALLRSLAVLDVPSLPRIRIPVDIPQLVQTAYAKEFTPPVGWETAMGDAQALAEHEADNRRTRAGTYLVGTPHGKNLVGWTAGVAGDLTSEVHGHAAVRDGQESLEVIVVQRRTDGLIYRWGSTEDDPPIPTDLEPPWRLAHQVAASTLRLSPALTQPYQIDRTIDALERTRFDGWQASGWLRDQLVLELDENCQTTLAGFHITYDDEIGLVATRQKGSND